MNVEFIIGDLLKSPEKYIAHQCNCVSHGAAGVAAAIFRKYPHSDIYSKRDMPSKTGQIVVCGNGVDERYVINMLSQFFPGRPDKSSANDNEFIRQRYFVDCLKQIAAIPDLTSIAFPAGIGCNLAGGDWNFYFKAIDKFAAFVKNRYNTKVVIYQLPNSEVDYKAQAELV